MKLILFFGIIRSGNHGLLNIFMNSTENIVHINNVELSIPKFQRNKKLPITNNRIDNKYTGFKGSDKVIISMENQIINFSNVKYFNTFYKNANIVILLRNPYNQFSSVWKISNKNSKILLKVKKLWIYYANLFIQFEHNNPFNFTRILYDKFYTDENYRSKILNELDIDYNIDINKFTKWGYSSFGEKSRNKRQYWGDIKSCFYRNDPKFTEIVDDNEIHDLWEKILELYQIKN